MIGWLSGVVRVKRPPVAVIDVNGVGYELEAPMSTFGILPALGGSIELHTHLVVRDDDVEVLRLQDFTTYSS